MTNTIHVDTFNNLAELFSDKLDARINRFRSPYLYRGLSNESFHLVPSLQRCCKSESNKLEPHTLNNFLNMQKWNIRR